MEQRTVQRVGGGTVTVSLPRQWARDHDIDAGTDIYLSPHTDGSLVLRPTKRADRPLDTVEISLDDVSPTEGQHVVRAAYRAGFKRVVLSSSTQITDELRRALTTAVRSLSGVDVVQETDAQIVFAGLIDGSAVSVRQMIVQLQFGTLSIIDTTEAVLAQDQPDMDHVRDRACDIHRMYNHVARHVTRSFGDVKALDDLGEDRIRLFQYLRLASLIRDVADHLVGIAEAASELDSKTDPEWIEEIRDIVDTTGDSLDTGIGAVIDGTSPNRALAALEGIETVESDTDTLRAAIRDADPVDGFHLATILDGVDRVTSRSRDLANIALQGAITAQSETSENTDDAFT